MTGVLTLGPVLYHWSADAKRAFYARIADEAPVDTVYLGEVICSKREPFFEPHYPEIIERLERGGKRVVLCSLAEVMLKRERAMMRALCRGEDREIEINNAAGLMEIEGRPHRIGPMMNVYNEETLAHLARRGARHVTLPVEVPRDVVARMAAEGAALGVGVEVQVFGRAPLALSARCYHARAHGRTRDNCQFVCEEDPDGMPLSTMTGEPFLAINGIQTLSHAYVSLAAEIGEMQRLGLRHFRLMPQQTDMVAVAEIFAECVAGRIGAEEAMARLGALALPVPFANGFWHAQAGVRNVGPRPG